MKRTIAWIVIAVAAALLPGQASAAGPDGPPSLVAACQGALVRPLSSATWQPLTSSRKIPPGATVKTSAQPASIGFPDGTRIELMPQSTMQIQAPTDVNLEPGRSTRVLRADLRQGAFEVAIPRGGRPVLSMVEQGKLVEFHDGTGALRRSERDTVAAALTGASRVVLSGKIVPMPAGNYIVLSSTGRQQGIQPLPAPPTFSTARCQATSDTPCAVGIAVDAGTSRLGVRWSLPATGVRSIVTLFRGASDGVPLENRELGAGQTEYATDPLPAGAYWIAIRAVNAHGLPGAAALRPLRVIQLLADSGVRWLGEDNALVFPAGRRVRVGGAHALWVTWDGRHWIGAPGELAVQDAERVQGVRFRLDGDGTDEVGLKIEPSGVRADVQLTPGNARWPGDRVRVTFRLRDGRGRIDVRTMYPRLQVTVNHEPVQVGLFGQQGTWYAEIPARRGSGPWAVRAQVLDPDDNVLGYGMLHVGGSRTDRSNW